MVAQNIASKPRVLLDWTECGHEREAQITAQVDSHGKTALAATTRYTDFFRGGKPVEAQVSLHELSKHVHFSADAFARNAKNPNLRLVSEAPFTRVGVELKEPLEAKVNGKAIAVYSGGMTEGVFQGKGWLTSIKQQKHLIGEFKDSYFEGRNIEFADGTWYEGDATRDEAHGVGKHVGPNGDYYEGEFRNGMMHGAGRYGNAQGVMGEAVMENGDPVSLKDLRHTR